MSEQQETAAEAIPDWADLKPELKNYVLSLLERELAKERHNTISRTLSQMEAKTKLVRLASLMPEAMAAGAVAGFSAMSEEPSPISAQELALSSALECLCPTNDDDDEEA